MALADVLRTIGLTLGEIGAQGGQSLAQAMQAQGSPLAYQQAQESARQHQQLLAQLQMHQMMSPYEQGMLDIQTHAQHRLDEQQAFEQGHQALLAQLGLAQDVHSGVLSPTSDSDAAFTANGVGYRINPQPPQARPVHFVPTAEEKQAYPWLTEFDIATDKAPAFFKDMRELDMTNPAHLRGIGDSLKSQVAALADPAQPALAQTYSFLIDDAMARGKPEDAYRVLDDVRKQKEEAVRKHSDLLAQNSPEMIAAAAAKAGAEESARTNVRLKQEETQDAVNFPAIRRAIENGETDLDSALSSRYTAGANARARYLAWESDNNLPPVRPLSPAAQADLRKLEPVIYGLEHLKAALEPLTNNNDPTFFTGDRLKYYLGLATPLTDVINQIELDRINGGVRVLGGIRNYQALRDAMVHLPQAWLGSPRKAYEQINNILNTNAYPAREDIYKYGNKYGNVQQGSSAVDDLVRKYGGR